MLVVTCKFRVLCCLKLYPEFRQKENLHILYCCCG